MPFQVSPGVNVSEIDLTTVVPAVASTEGALAGVFRWGPVGQRTLIDSEINLVSTFGKPSNFNPETFFTAANFLSYGNKLYVVRAANTTPDASNVNSTVLTPASASGNVILTSNVVNTASLSSGDFAVINGVTYTLSSVNGAANTVVLSGVANAAAIPSISGATVVFQKQTTAYNAFANSGVVTNFEAFIVKNDAEYEVKDGLGQFASVDSDALYIARYPGALGNSLRVAVCDTATAFSTNLQPAASNTVFLDTVPDTSINASASFILSQVGNNVIRVFVANTATGAQGLNGANTRATSILQRLSVGDLIEVGNTVVGKQLMVIKTLPTDTGTGSSGSVLGAFFDITCEEPQALSANVSQQTLPRFWSYYNSFDSAPGISLYQSSQGNAAAQDELHVVVVDEDGKFSGVPGTILEVFSGVSRATDAKTAEGAANYYKTVINENSRYVWFANDRSGAASNTALNVLSSSNLRPLSLSFRFGQDGLDESNVAVGTVLTGYDLFRSAEEVDISLVLTGKSRGGTAGGQIAQYLIDNIAEYRKDCVVFVSPDRADVVNNVGNEAASIVDFRNTLPSTSYAVLDSGYKYQYDKYNDVYRWVPLNGDAAGLCVRTDETRDPWWSPAGFNRGQIKNIVKLAYNPQKSERDILYKSGINPVVTFPGQGTVLYGDKTLLSKPSAFDRINVRRLFIVLEKAISTAAKFTLFEFNDEFTRAQFRNLVEPFLRDVQGRRGIYDFKVVCDTTNNTGEVIDRNEFVGDIYIKPAKSINFIQLNFVAVRTGVEFSEVVGSF